MASEEELSATTNAGTAIDAQLPDPALAAPARTRGRRGGRGRGRRGAATMDQPEEAPLVAAEAPREEQVPPMGNEESTGLVVPREQAVAEGEARVAAADAPAEPPLSGEGEAPEGSPAAPRAVRRGRSRTPSSPVKVNVGIPRGLGRRISARLIEQVVQLALEREGWQTPALLDIHLIDDDEMRAVNAARRGIDEVTDVLSFPLLDLLPGKGLQHDFFVLPPDEPAHLGEVVISYPRVEAQAEEAGHSRERELAFLTVHGVLHVLGYDHDTDERRRQMRRREEDVLSELGLRRTPSG